VPSWGVGLGSAVAAALGLAAALVGTLVSLAGRKQPAASRASAQVANVMSRLCIGWSLLTDPCYDQGWIYGLFQKFASAYTQAPGLAKHRRLNLRCGPNPDCWHRAQ
ncbi:MAG: hypothetical protein GYB67_15320, partial [Chloroflexi bacterium]|nr:hypothetical protein [Chloroflexota bacterium]